MGQLAPVWINGAIGETFMKKSSLSLVILAATTLLLAACSPKTTTTTPAVQTAQPQGLIAEGRLAPLNQMDLAFTTSGQVLDVMVKDGESVQAGQELARLSVAADAKLALARAQQEALSAQQALDTLQASADSELAKSRLAYLDAVDELDQAQARYDGDASDRNKALLEAAGATLKLAEDAQSKLEKGQGIDPDQLALAQARLDTANAAVDSAQAYIDAHTLKAAISGKVVDLTLQNGQQVAGGVPLVTIADFSGWRIETDNLTEMEIAQVSVGQKVKIVLDALPALTFQGEVTHIDVRFVEKRGDITYTVTIRVEQSDPQMRWGMTAAVYFQP